MKRNFDQLLSELMRQTASGDDSHGWHHLYRVRTVALKIAEQIEADKEVIIAAAWLHDLVVFPKNDSRRKLSSTFSAEKAKSLLEELGFNLCKIPLVCHAIAAHSFSAGITPETMEAKILQDSDRIDALGALGMLRCFYTSGRLGRQLMHGDDPLAKNRPLNDIEYGLDHFEVKLFKLIDMLNTEPARVIAFQRAEWLREYRDFLVSGDKDALSIANACTEAGKIEMKLFDCNDPFAEKREVDAATYFLDSFLEIGYGAADFLGQLRAELHGESQRVSGQDVVAKSI